MVDSLAKILVVDDHPKYLADTLPMYGYEVQVAYDGIQAVQMLTNSNQHFDLVVLDVMMPNMDGFEVLKVIRSKEYLEELPVIMLTAVDAEQKQVSGLKFGADDYIVKPFSLPNFLARIEAILRRSKIKEKRKSDKALDLAFSTDEPVAPLTTREKEVLELVAKGANNMDISKKLFIREVTVKTHMNNIFKKLNVSNRTQAILLAMQMNIIK
ncbi:MAG: response regulator transcription factor [Candidatus Gastranaerophilales bacterium]|nr:response regulator transcription factor [Candidatus Gastranaerophilales bacterium]